jgi:hypothetical protein
MERQSVSRKRKKGKKSKCKCRAVVTERKSEKLLAQALA